MGIYYLKHFTSRGSAGGYHKVEAANLPAAVRKFNKGTTYTTKQVRRLKRVPKGETRNYIPVRHKA